MKDLHIIKCKYNTGNEYAVVSPQLNVVYGVFKTVREAKDYRDKCLK